jgi:hypothetical protein
MAPCQQPTQESYLGVLVNTATHRPKLLIHLREGILLPGRGPVRARHTTVYVRVGCPNLRDI